ncbi:MAG TPA: hypothetical protein VFB01_15500 [Burkholderiales bacterium]|nr:hypothetical protein [Burkholderiales bacterium]
MRPREGTIYAVDIDPDMIQVLRERARSKNATNVEIVSAKPGDPFLLEKQSFPIFAR